ncbi:SH3 domain-containing protein [Ascidiimonas aurantiaca]|uniref:SH3 domain-containing protein n=1 Tax=Ascidiimonas aurantiaca TaxID=1685432 RepID=UPI0030EE1ECB
MKQFLCLLFLLIIPLTGFGQNTQLFEEASKAYNEGDYETAIEKYMAILDNGEHSASLYYNLGNAHYKLNHIAPSIYYYEKALLLAPDDPDVQNNILFARNMTLDAIEPLPQTGIARLLEKSIGKLSYNTWAIIAITAMIFFVASFLLYYFSYRRNYKRAFFIVSLSTLFLVFFSVFMGFHEYNKVQNNRPAIVFAEETLVKSEPNPNSEEVFRLHEGTKVQVLEIFQEWSKIQLADGKIGWLSTDDIKEIKTL